MSLKRLSDNGSKTILKANKLKTYLGKKKEKVKNTLMGLVLVAMMYMLMVIMFILDGAPFHPHP